ncbi:molybdenum cofactor guanylyltransferase [Bacteroidota bacterium]
MVNNKKITGIILSGGKSSRMKTEKGLVKILGKELIQYAIENLSPICDEIIISSNSDGYDKFGYKVIADEIKNIGPVGGLYSCIKRSSNDINFVLSCDTPLVKKEILQCLLSNFEGDVATVPCYKDDHYEPLCAIYTKGFLKVLEQALKNKNHKLPLIYTSTKIRKVQVEDHIDCFTKQAFFNVNSMEDVKRLEDILAKK